MNKLFLFIWLLIAVPSGTDCLWANIPKDSITIAKKEIKIDYGSPVNRNTKPLNFKSKYQTKEFKYESIIQEKSLWERFKEWLRAVWEKLFGLTPKRASWLNELILQILTVAVIAFVIYRIVKIILNKEGQWVFGKSTTKKIIHENDIEKNLIHVDFEKLIAQTLQEENYRLAVRYYYLWVLKSLSEKNIIDWHVDKTNTDYLYEIQAQGLKSDFQYLSYLYNHIWYGEFEMNKENFLYAQRLFKNTIQSVSR